VKNGNKITRQAALGIPCNALNDRLESGSNKHRTAKYAKCGWHIIITNTRKITPEELGGLLNTAIIKVKETGKAIKGVRNTGICSQNLHVFRERDIKFNVLLTVHHSAVIT
jgi:hypothetical protein